MTTHFSPEDLLLHYNLYLAGFFIACFFMIAVFFFAIYLFAVDKGIVLLGSLGNWLLSLIGLA